jgi:transcriptional regulator with XRE-family HTH domain
MNSLGQKVKRLREIKGWKQEYMADRLNISQQSYSNIESGKVDVPFSRIEEIATVFEIKPEELVSFDEKYVLNNYGEVSGNSNVIGVNYFPSEIKQLYEDKIKLLEDKIQLMELLAKK